MKTKSKNALLCSFACLAGVCGMLFFLTAAPAGGAAAVAATVPGPAAGYVRLEAEDAILNAAVADGSESNFSGTGLVRSMDYLGSFKSLPESLADFSYVEWRFRLAEKTRTTLTIGYNSDAEDLSVALLVNGEKRQVALEKGASWNEAKRSEALAVELAAGENRIVVTAPLTETNPNGWIDVDYIDLQLDEKPTLEGGTTGGEQISRELGGGVTRYEPSYRWEWAKYTANEAATPEITLLGAKSSVNSSVTFLVTAASDGYYRMDVRYRVEKYTSGFPMHEISVSNGSWKTTSAVTAGVLDPTKVNRDGSTYSPMLYYDDTQILKWHDAAIKLYLKAGDNEVRFSVPYLFTSGSNTVANAVVTLDHIDIGGNIPDAAAVTDDLADMSKLQSYSPGISHFADDSVGNTSSAPDTEQYVVYRLGADITAFTLTMSVQHQDYFGGVYVSPTGLDGSWLAVRTVKTPRLYYGNGNFRRTVVSNESAIGSGMRFLKIVFPPVYQEDNLKALHASQDLIRLSRAEIYADSVEEVQVSTPTAHQVVQRDADDTATVTVTGVLKAAGTDAYVTLATKDGKKVNGFTRVKAAKDSANCFEAVLRKVPAGLYDVLVEAMSGGAVTSSATVESFGVGDVWIIAGQSNSAGNAKRTPEEEGLYEEPTDGVSVFYPDTQAWVLGEQPIGENKGQPDYSSLALSFAKNIMAKTGFPVGMVHTGVGGTSITKWALNKSGFLYEYQLRSCFIKNERKIRGVLWNQGTTDTNQYFVPTPQSIGLTNPHDDTCTVYEYRFMDLVANLRADFNDPSLPIITNQIGHTNSENKYWATIREVQRAVASDNSVHRIDGVYVVPTNDGILWDGWLHNSMGMNQVLARRMADIALAEVYGDTGVTNYLFPDIKKAYLVSNKRIVLEFDNVPNGFYADMDFKKEFNVTSASGNRVEIVSADIAGLNGDKIVLTTATLLNGKETVGGLSDAVLDGIALRTNGTRFSILSFYGIPLEKKISADTTDIEASIASAESIDLSGYTPASAKAVQSALEYAKLCALNSFETDEDTLLKAKSALDAAVGSLEERKAPPHSYWEPYAAPNVGLIVGLSVGGGVLLLAAGFAAWYFVWGKKLLAARKKKE